MNINPWGNTTPDLTSIWNSKMAEQGKINPSGLKLKKDLNHHDLHLQKRRKISFLPFILKNIIMIELIFEIKLERHSAEIWRGETRKTSIQETVEKNESNRQKKKRMQGKPEGRYKWEFWTEAAQGERSGQGPGFHSQKTNEWTY